MENRKELQGCPYHRGYQEFKPSGTAFIKSCKLVGRFLGYVFKHENFTEEISFYDA